MEEILYIKNGQFLGYFNLRLVCQLSPFMISSETLNTSIFGLLLFFWKPCKFELPVYSLTRSVGVGIKFVFSIEGVGCEVTGLKGRSLVTGGSTSKTIW